MTGWQCSCLRRKALGERSGGMRRVSGYDVHDAYAQRGFCGSVVVGVCMIAWSIIRYVRLVALIIAE